MSLDNLANMFSQRSGVQQSIASTVMSTIMSYMMQHFMQKGLSGFLGSGGKDQNSMKSALSQLQNQANDPNHELVQQVKNNAGLKDTNQAKQYTQQAVGMMHEHADNNPQEMHSAFGNVANSKGFDLGSILGGLTGQNSNSQQQQQKKQGIGDMLGF
jgi:hypothetical protein